MTDAQIFNADDLESTGNRFKTLATMEREGEYKPERVVPVSVQVSTISAELTLDVDVSGTVGAAVKEIAPAYDHGGIPCEPTHVEDLCISVRIPARCIRQLDSQGYVRVDLTDFFSEKQREEAEAVLIGEAAQ